MKKKTTKHTAKEAKKTKRASSGWLRTILAATGLLGCFFVVLALITDYASPNRYTSPESLSELYTILESAGGTYFGPVVDTVYSGNGEFQYLDGGTYEGEFQNNQREGDGTFYWDNGDTFTGTWSGDEMISGTYTFADGRSYTGSFEGNTFQDGVFSLGGLCANYGLTSYEANLVDSEITTLGFETVDGLSFKGSSTGEATITYPSGDVYAGNVVDGARDGEGTYTWAAGPSYVGEWNNGIMSGSGEYHYTDQEYPYLTATFIDNKPWGNAVYYKEAGNTFDTVWEGGICISVVES